MIKLKDIKHNQKFQIYMNSSKLTAEQKSEILEIEITELSKEPTTFTITLSSLIATWLKLYNYTKGASEPVKIQPGTKDHLGEILNGEITEVDFGDKNKESKTHIKGKSHIHRLMKQKETRAYLKMTHAEIIEKISNKSGSRNEANIPISRRSNRIQRNQSNYDFLMNLAAEHS